MDRQAVSALAALKTATSGEGITHSVIPAAKPASGIILYLMALPVSDNRIVFASIMYSISQRAPPVALL